MFERDSNPEIAEDSALSPVEKQLSFVGTKADSDFLVHSEIASVTRWLLDHPAFEERDRRVLGGAVVAITGTIPVGLLNLKYKPRSVDQFARMLSQATLSGRGEEQ